MLPEGNDLRKLFNSNSKEDKRRFKQCASQRIRTGVADCDVWSFDSYLLNVIIVGLQTLADNTCSYPGYPPYNTLEKWRTFLLDLADKFLQAKRYIYLEDNYNWEHPQEEVNARIEEGYKLLKEAFIELAEHLPSMWD